MSFPTTPIIDAFNRANEDPLSDGGKWSLGPVGFTAGDIFDLVGNEIRWDGLGSFANNYRNDLDYGPACEVYVTTPVVAASYSHTLYLRLVDIGSGASDGYACIWSNVGNSIRSLTNASLSGALVSFTQLIAAGDSFGFSVQGATLQAWYKPSGGEWGQKASISNTTYPAAGKIGIRTTDATWRFDNFGGGTIVSPEAPSMIVVPSGIRW